MFSDQIVYRTKIVLTNYSAISSLSSLSFEQHYDSYLSILKQLISTLKSLFSETWGLECFGILKGLQFKVYGATMYLWNFVEGSETFAKSHACHAKVPRRQGA